MCYPTDSFSLYILNSKQSKFMGGLGASARFDQAQPSIGLVTGTNGTDAQTARVHRAVCFFIQNTIYIKLYRTFSEDTCGKVRRNKRTVSV